MEKISRPQTFGRKKGTAENFWAVISNSGQLIPNWGVVLKVRSLMEKIASPKDRPVKIRRIIFCNFLRQNFVPQQYSPAKKITLVDGGKYFRVMSQNGKKVTPVSFLKKEGL